MAKTAPDAAPAEPTSSKSWLTSDWGGFILHPWFDTVSVKVLADWYFPLSRFWASAIDCDGDAGRFAELVPLDARPESWIGPIISAMQRRRRAARHADLAWEQGLFGTGDLSPKDLAELEQARHDRSHDLMAARAILTPLKMRYDVPPVHWQIRPPSTIAQKHGARLSHPATAFALPAPLPAVEASRTAPVGGIHMQWLRFPSPVAETGTAWARVDTPAGWQVGGPSLVFGHGIAMEVEHWQQSDFDPLAVLLDKGVRIVRPEGPWHGRRRAQGFYGGEPVLAYGPDGLLTYFQAMVAEMGVLIDWARGSGGPVAAGGVSLGALSAQVLTGAAQSWPQSCRPDAILLVVPSKSLTPVAFTGSLTRGLGVPEALRSGGWTPERLAKWRPLLDAPALPALPPERIVAALGRADTVTPYAEGLDLVRGWKVPENNIFIWDRGHFSTSLGLARDPEPLHRLAAILKGLE